MSQSHHVSDHTHASVTPKHYWTGFILSVILTVAAFASVMSHIMSPEGTLWFIAILAMIQIAVQIHYFLHIDFSESQRSNLLALILTIIFVAILLGASLWIMYHMNLNMMPWMHH